MVGNLDVEKSSQKPILPLHTFFSYRTSPSTVKLVGLPNRVGDWKIEEVFVQYTYPDGVERSSTAKSIGNEFVATLDAPEASGTSKNGLKVVANCIDENGRHVDGFILAVGDIDILELDGEVHPGETVYTLKYLDAQPANPKKGDTYLDNGWLRIYDGENWSEKPQIDVPTKVSELENDKGFLTDKDIKPSTNPLYEGQGVAFRSELSEWSNYTEHITWSGVDDKPEVLDAPENIATKNYVDTKIQNQPTMTLSGEYEDGTTFSFDVVKK